jgi:hypothetical protein
VTFTRVVDDLGLAYNLTGLPSGDGGGSTPGAAVVRGPFEFAFNTPGLVDGVEFYTPTVGDIFLDAWIEVLTNWDGTTPTGDIGVFRDLSTGLLPSPNGQDMTQISMSTEVQELSGGTGTFAQRAFQQLNQRRLPGVFENVHPFKVVVSQDGTKGGTDPGATQGSARLYIVTVTPVGF